MENRIVNMSITVKQAEEAIEFWLNNAVLKRSQRVREVNWIQRELTFTIAFQQEGNEPES